MIILLYDLEAPVFNANSGPSGFFRSRHLKAAGNQGLFDETGQRNAAKNQGSVCE
jgi:hypothetical protein